MSILGDYIKIKHGYAFKGTGISTEDNGVVLVTPGNFAIGGGFKEDKCKFFTEDYPEEYCLSEDDLIVTMTDLSKDIDTLGYSALVPASDRIYLHNQRIGFVELIRDDVDKHFIYWFMRTYKYQRTIAGSASGTTVHHTSPGRICDVEVAFPSYEMQKKIAFVLDSIEDKIKLNEEINKNLEQQTRTLFREWLIINADSRHMHPLSKIASINEEIYSLNEDWEYINYLDTSSITTGTISEIQHINPRDEKLPSRARRKIRANDIVYSTVRPNQQHYGIITNPMPYMLVSTGFAVVRSKTASICNELIYLCLTEPSFTDKMQQIAEQSVSTFPSIKPSDLDTCLVPEPMQDDEDMIIKIKSCFSIMAINHQENQRLSALRDTLLPKLMSGELDVSNIDI